MAEVDPIDRRRVTSKLGEHGFGCALRIAARAGTTERMHNLVAEVGAALRGLEVPHVRVRLRHTPTQAVVSVVSPWLWPLWLRESDLVPLLGWPTADPPLPGLPSPHPKQLPAAPAVATTGAVIGCSTTDPSRSVALSVEDSLRHLHVIGPTGVGKSTLLAGMILDDIAAGRGAVVIDPKGDLVDDIATRVPNSRLDDVVILDARDPAPVGLNVLAGGTGSDPELRADVLLSVFHSLYADAWGPRTHDILHACLLSLARRAALQDEVELDVSLVLVPLLLTNAGFRRSVVQRVAKADPMGLGSFWAWFEGISEAERSTVIAPLMNKLRSVLLRPGLRAVFGQRRPRFDLADIFQPTDSGQGRILLVSLAKGTLGPEAAQLLGSVVVATLWQQSLGRIAVAAARRSPVTVAIDEVQDYLRLPGDLGDALVQARGLGVGFVLAHQHLGQLPKSIHAAVMANARSRVAFELAAADARVIAGMSRGALEPADYLALPAFHAYAQLLAGGTTQPPVSITTSPLGPRLRSAEIARAHSRTRYGQPLDAVEADLLNLLDPEPPSDEPLGRGRVRGGVR